MSMPDSAYFKIASIVAWWLSQIPECPFNSSTKTICDSLKDVKLEEDEDVVSLYTNVPVNEAIQVAADLIFNGKNPQPPVDKETFIELAEVASCDVIMLTRKMGSTDRSMVWSWEVFRLSSCKRLEGPIRR